MGLGWGPWKQGCTTHCCPRAPPDAQLALVKCSLSGPPDATHAAGRASWGQGTGLVTPPPKPPSLRDLAVDQPRAARVSHKVWPPGLGSLRLRGTAPPPPGMESDLGSAPSKTGNALSNWQAGGRGRDPWETHSPSRVCSWTRVPTHQAGGLQAEAEGWPLPPP